MIYILTIGGSPLCGCYSAQLFALACEMARLSKTKKHFSWGGVWGTITTDYSLGCLGGITGIIFQVTFETDEAKFKSSFIVRTQDIRAAGAMYN